MAFGIALEYPKKWPNIGTALRSAYNFDAAFIAVIGRRYTEQHSDTVKAHRHIPLLHFQTWNEYHSHAPFGWIPIAVELLPHAKPLPELIHPKQAIYLFGPEDGTLSQEAQNLAARHVMIPSRFCLNLAVAVSIVMYDRQTKLEA